MENKAQLKLGQLTALVVGSMIGGGIFSIPQNIADSSGVAASIIAWAITGVGMLALAFVFVNLTLRQPQLDSGIYAYARAALGPFMGFSSAWGYWFMAVMGNVGYYVLFFSTIGHYTPIFKNGNTPAAIICASIMLWATHFLVLRGIKEAAKFNQIVTLAKLIPLTIFVILAAIYFDPKTFTADIWGQANPKLGGILDQVKGMMLVTVWVFIGVEGASVYSARAEKRTDVGRATFLGFLFTLALMVAISLLSMGILSQPQLAELSNPSMAHVLTAAVGQWGGGFIAIGILISLSGALLSWLLLSSETLYMAAKDGSAPEWLAAENSQNVPSNAMWLTSGCVQLFLLITYISDSTYLSLVNLGTSMVLLPYAWAALYGCQIAWRGIAYEAAHTVLRRRDIAISAVAITYSAWLMYAAGIKYLLLSALLYTPGAIFYAWARRKNPQGIFSRTEWAFFAALVILSIIAAAALYKGKLSL